MAKRLAGDSRTLRAACWIAAGVVVLFVAMPLFQLYAMQTPASIARAASDGSVAHSIALSIEAATITAALAGLLGIPVAYLLARNEFAGKGLIEAIIDLPLAVPHTVVGIALLFVFGRTGVVGAPVAALTGLHFWGSAGGVVVAMLYVGLPYTVGAAREAFRTVDPRLERVSRTLGAGPWGAFLRVTIPLAWRGIASGLTMSGARALSEFGAVIILAYYPLTAPVKIYDLFLEGGLRDSAAASVLFLSIVLALFIALRRLTAAQRLTRRP